MGTDYRHSDLTGKIIGAAYAVYNALGHGFLEKVYENALAVELNRLGLLINFGPEIEIKRRIFDQ